MPRQRASTPGCRGNEEEGEREKGGWRQEGGGKGKGGEEGRKGGREGEEREFTCVCLNRSCHCSVVYHGVR